jgi:hypothetical protein
VNNPIPIPKGAEEWSARVLPKANEPKYLFKQVVLVEGVKGWQEMEDPNNWHGDWIRPGFIVDPIFSEAGFYRLYFWTYDHSSGLFLPVVNAGPYNAHMSNLCFFHFFPDRLVVPAFKALKNIQ